MVWGIDLIGLLPITRPAFKYVVVVVNYFMKWAEAQPLVMVSNKKGTRFYMGGNNMLIQ